MTRVTRTKAEKERRKALDRALAHYEKTGQAQERTIKKIMAERTMKKTGGDYFTLTEIRTMLRKANEHFDGVGELAFIQEGKEPPELRQVAITGQEPVVVIPGDGRPFPEHAYAEALRVAPVIVERE